MKRLKNLIFTFFISTTIIANSYLLHGKVYAADSLPNPKSKAYTSDENIFTKYGYKGQCTWFTYGRVIEKLGILLPSEFHGNAIDWWYANEKDKVFEYGSEPKPNSIVVWSGGNRGYGHVGFVENVKDNTVYFTEGNYSVKGAYDGQVKSVTKSALKDRGNLHLKGYIYINEKYSSTKHNDVPASSKPATPSKPSSDKEESTLKKGTINLSDSNSRLNVRKDDDISSQVIGTLKSGDTINIVESSGDWYKIKFNSTYGYINSKYVKL